MQHPAYETLQQRLKAEPKTWLITGVAGFIGSNLLEALLKLDQRVVGLDNLSTGYQRNLDEVRAAVSPAQWSNFHFIYGDIRDLHTCRQAMTWPPSSNAADTHARPVDYVLHQAALGSVPRSIEDPLATHQSNLDGFLNILIAARDAQVERLVYASSSAVYGDHPALPKIEDRIGAPLSPYTLTKRANELYAEVLPASMP